MMTHEKKWEVLCAAIQRRYPVLASVWIQAPRRFGPRWVAECVPNIETAYGAITDELSEQLLEMIDGYAEFCNDAMRNQVYFEKTGRYRASSYADVARDCYHNEEHMTRRYLPGMFVSHFVWPQHYSMQRGFQDLLLPRVRDSRTFFEVGVGCGVYSKLTLAGLPDIRGTGFDISQFSLDYTSWMLNAFGLRDRYALENFDIRNAYHTACDFLICQEVLEHLENPAEFCDWLAKMVRPGGHAYITAALNAAHSDHIYLFRNPAQLEDMVRAAGLQPLHVQEEFAPGNKPRNLTPSLCGFFCEKSQ
jgi:2-polyprenyl-3-methyl-5-hydroxy-6-metoxy-1,4-benzoquinol methylase